MQKSPNIQKKQWLKVAVIAGLGLSLTACTQEESGSFWGAIVGGLVGSAVAGDSRDADMFVFMGAAIGSEVGAAQGRKLDEADAIRQYHAHQDALEDGSSGQRYDWSNPDTGTRGYIEPEPAYKNPYNEFCREYTQTVVIGDEEEKAYGKACRQPDGSWKIADDE